MTALHVFVEGIGVLGPGMDDWQQAAQVLAGHAPYLSRPTVLPPPDGLPSAERRRSGMPVKLALAVGWQATRASGLAAASLPAFFTASSGDGYVYHAICEALAGEDPFISPTRFHNSVHNAPAGYWSIASGAMTASNVTCAHDGSFGAGLLDAATQVVSAGQPCLLIAYDTPYPEPLHSARPLPDAFGLALVLAPQPGPRTVAQLDIALDFSEPDQAAPTTRMQQPELEMLRHTIPAGRALPLLRLLAQPAGALDDDGTHTEALLDYLDGLRVRVGVRSAR